MIIEFQIYLYIPSGRESSSHCHWRNIAPTVLPPPISTHMKTERLSRHTLWDLGLSETPPPPSPPQRGALDSARDTRGGQLKIHRNLLTITVKHCNTFVVLIYQSTCFSQPMRPSNSLRSLWPGKLTPEVVAPRLTPVRRSHPFKSIASTPTSSSSG